MRRIADQYGPEAVATTSGTGRTHDEIRARFFNILGSPNHIGAGEICYGPTCVMGYTLFGWRVFPVVRSHTRCILLWGGGGPRYWDAFWRAAKRAKQDHGAKIIVIDPRRTDSTSHADLWLQIRPGTDCALALGMIHHIIEEDLYDEEFVKKWCYGFDQLKTWVKNYTIDRVAEITRIPGPKIRQAAEWYATLKPGVTNHGMGLEHQANSIQAVHAHYILSAITGNTDIPGGDIFPSPHPLLIHGRKSRLMTGFQPNKLEKPWGSIVFV